MTDLQKTLERLEKRLSEMLDKYRNAECTNSPHNLPDEGLFNSTCDSLCAVRREMREAEPRDPFLNYCPTCACRLPRPHELKDFRCPDSGGEPPCTCPLFMGSRPPVFCVHCDLEREEPPPAEPNDDMASSMPSYCQCPPDMQHIVGNVCEFCTKMVEPGECEHRFWGGRECMKCHEFRLDANPESPPAARECEHEFGDCDDFACCNPDPSEDKDGEV